MPSFYTSSKDTWGYYGQAITQASTYTIARKITTDNAISLDSLSFYTGGEIGTYRAVVYNATTNALIAKGTPVTSSSSNMNPVLAFSPSAYLPAGTYYIGYVCTLAESTWFSGGGVEQEWFPVTKTVEGITFNIEAGRFYATNDSAPVNNHNNGYQCVFLITFLLGYGKGKVNIGGVLKNKKDQWVNINGTWKTVAGQWVNINGVWKQEI